MILESPGLDIPYQGLVATAETAVIANTKPLLRGYLHAVTTVGALAGTIVLFRLSVDDVTKQITLLVYGISSILLFGCSAFYHIPNWSSRRHALMRRIDQSCIFIVIAGTYTPITSALLTGRWRAGLLIAVWMLALSGIVTVTHLTTLSRFAVVGLYVAVGCVAVAALPAILTRVSQEALALLALGGATYIVGALVYAIRWPSPWPRVWGYHEVFHLATVVAAAMFFIFMLKYVVP